MTHPWACERVAGTVALSRERWLRTTAAEGSRGLPATPQGNAIGSIFYTPGNFFNPTLIGEAITGIPAGRKLSQFTKSPGPDGNPDPYGFIKGVRYNVQASGGVLRHPPA